MRYTTRRTTPEEQEEIATKFRIKRDLIRAIEALDCVDDDALIGILAQALPTRDAPKGKGRFK